MEFYHTGYYQVILFLKTLIMKRICLLMVLMMSINLLPAQKGTNYGMAVSSKKAMDLKRFTSIMDTAVSWTGVISGKVLEVCKMEGCWLRLDDGSEQGIFVRMKDHEFTVPKDISGKTVYVMGTATKSTTTVKMLQHYAKDAGKSREEIEKITQPKTEIKMDAMGVKVI